MAPRVDLQLLLEQILGSRNVYFQPPANVMMRYPAIVYERDDVDSRFAGNRPYSLTNRYQVTVIDEDPESHVLEQIQRLPLCSFSRHYAADNLNHDVYSLYF